jgi:hypothetical protein
LIAIGYEDTSDAQKRQVFHYFVAKCPRTDNDDPGVCEELLVPPVNEPKSREAIVVGRGRVVDPCNFAHLG